MKAERMANGEWRRAHSKGLLAAVSCLLADERGLSTSMSYALVQVPFWLLFCLIVVVSLVGLKQTGTASLAHLAARSGGTTGLAAGRQVALQHGAVWGVPGAAATLSSQTGQRAVTVNWRFQWQTNTLLRRFLEPFTIGVQELERYEAFYAGPPGAWE